jgi:hypothetical protein
VSDHSLQQASGRLIQLRKVDEVVVSLRFGKAFQIRGRLDGETDAVGSQDRGKPPLLSAGFERPL